MVCGKKFLELIGWDGQKGINGWIHVFVGLAEAVARANTIREVLHDLVHARGVVPS